MQTPSKRTLPDKVLRLVIMDKINVSVVVLALALSVTVVTSATRKLRWVVDDDGCRTPDNGVGDCISLSQCRTLSALASDRRNIRELQKYLCSYRSSVISVCCPRKSIEVTTFRLVNDNVNLLPTDCGIFSSNHKITNGEKTDLFEFPWQVALRYDDRVSPFACAGTLISNRYVLTAAHCTRGTKLIGVRLGEHNFLTNPDCHIERNRTTCAPEHIDIAVSKEDVIEHEKFVPKALTNDIALIRLPREIQFSDSVSPVCLPVRETLRKDLGNLTVIGWGRTESNQPSPVLLKVAVPLMDINSCRGVFRKRIDITDNQFCAGGKDGKDSCKGDSGGPIMYTVAEDGEIRWVQAGIVSFGVKFCGTERVPAMYTKLTSYTDWIVNNLKP